MFYVVVSEKGGAQKRIDFDKKEITIGRVQGNDIILPKGNVSKRHSRIVLKDGKFIIVDLKSTNGTYVNGRKISSPQVIKATDKIYIGDFILHVEEGEAMAAAPPAAGPASAAAGPPSPPPAPAAPVAGPPSRPVAPAAEARSSGAAPRVSRGDSTPQPPPGASPGQSSPGGGMSGPGAQAAAGAALDEAPRDDMEAPPPPLEARPPRPAPRREAPPPPAPAPAPAQAARPMEAVRPVATPPPAERPVPRPTAQLAAPGRDARAEGPPRVEPRPAGPAPRLVPSERMNAVQPPSGAAAPVAAERRAAPVPAGEAPPAHVQLQREIHTRLEEYLDLRGLDPARPAGEDLWEKTENAICDIVEQLESDGGLPPGVSQESLVKDVLHEALGMGPLEGLLQDPTVTQIMVNRPDRIYAVRNGATERVAKVFSSDKTALAVVARLLAPIGRKVDEATPVCDARLKDGSLLNVVVPPVAVFGPTFTLRKLVRTTWALDHLTGQGTLSREMAELLKTAVENRRSVVVAGPAGAGKTALIGALVSLVPTTERVVTVEEVAELSPHQENVVSLESRPGVDGRAPVGVRDVLRNALRMRPDRLIVGELRGPETLDLLQAMQTGHEGVITSINAGSPREALHRLESLALCTGVDLPTRALRAIISEAVQLLVQLARYADGSVKVVQITEVGELQGDVITLQDIFYFQQESFDHGGKVRGRFSSSGYAPRFYEDLRNRGVDVNMGIFHA